MRRAAPVSRQPPFAWSAAGSAADEASIAYIDLSDNAPFCGLPTSLLNHETSVTSFRAVEPRTKPRGVGRGHRRSPMGLGMECESFRAAQQDLNRFFSVSESGASGLLRAGFPQPRNQRQSSITRLSSGELAR